MSKQQLTETDIAYATYASIRVLWKLPAYFTGKLTNLFLLRLKAGAFYDDTRNENNKEYLRYGGYDWEVCFFNTTSYNVDLLPEDTELLISMRYIEGPPEQRIALVTVYDATKDKYASKAEDVLK